MITPSLKSLSFGDAHVALVTSITRLHYIKNCSLCCLCKDEAIFYGPSHFYCYLYSFYGSVKFFHHCGLSPTVFSCDFDQNLCGFVQSKNDKFDWTVRSGSTPSSSTGPSADASGNGK